MMIRENRFLGEFSGVDAAWRGMIGAITQGGTDVAGTIDPLTVGSLFGTHPRDYRELLGASLAIRNPRDRLVLSRVRRINCSYLLANVVWTVVGSDELSRIGFYNPRGYDFSDDGKTLAAAMGKRICRSSQGDQVAICSALLSRDPTTRRAVISVFIPQDVGSLHRDCSCVLTMQFLRRNEQLHCIVCIRSQSAIMLFPYDAFLLTMLHESMAVQLGISTGTLLLQYGSLHYYHDESECAAHILTEAPMKSPPEMPPMVTPLPVVARALSEAEQEIRCTGRFSRCEAIDPYWMTYMTALEHAVHTGEATRVKQFLPECLSSSWYAAIQ